MITIKSPKQIVEDLAQNSKPYKRVNALLKDSVVEDLAQAGEAIAVLLPRIPERMENDERETFQHFVNLAEAMREYQRVKEALNATR